MRRHRFTPTETLVILRMGRVRRLEDAIIQTGTDRKAVMALRNKGLVKLVFDIDTNNRVQRFLELTDKGRELI